MFGKFFASTFTGSMMASGADIFAVWAYVIANAYGSRVELNPRLLAAIIGATPERMSVAIDALCATDPDSRSKDNEGRRLVKEGEYQYLVVNHEKYRRIRNEEDRKEYNRDAKRRERARSSQTMSNGVSMTVNDCQACQPIQKQKQNTGVPPSIKAKIPNSKQPHGKHPDIQVKGTRAVDATTGRARKNPDFRDLDAMKLIA